MSATQVNIDLPVDIDFVDLAHALSSGEKLDLIMTLDEHECDLHFTKELIKKLVYQVKAEYTDYYDEVDPEFKKFIKSLKKV